MPNAMMSVPVSGQDGGGVDCGPSLSLFRPGNTQMILCEDRYPISHFSKLLTLIHKALTESPLLGVGQSHTPPYICSQSPTT